MSRRERMMLETAVQLVDVKTLVAPSPLAFIPGKSKVVTYGRVSSLEQMKKSFSPERQNQRTTDFVIKHGQSVWRAYMDEAETGRTTDRPEWKRCLQEIKPFPGTIIVMELLSRAGRENENFFEARRQAEEVSATILFVELGSGVDRDAEDQAAMRTNMYYHQSMTLMRNGREVALQAGVWGARPPAGFISSRFKMLEKAK